MTAPDISEKTRSLPPKSPPFSEPAFPLRNASGNAPSQEVLGEAILRIRSVAEPRRIILFGSAAKEEMHSESDIDLLVVVDSRNKTKNLKGKILRAIHADEKDHLWFDFDVFVETQAAISDHEPSPADVLGSALLEGRTIYRTPSKTGGFARAAEEQHQIAKRLLCEVDFRNPVRISFESALQRLRSSIAKSLAGILFARGYSPGSLASIENLRRHLLEMGENPPLPPKELPEALIRARETEDSLRFQVPDDRKDAEYAKAQRIAKRVRKWAKARHAEISEPPIPSGKENPS